MLIPILLILIILAILSLSVTLWIQISKFRGDLNTNVEAIIASIGKHIFKKEPLTKGQIKMNKKIDKENAKAMKEIEEDQKLIREYEDKFYGETG